MLQRLRDNFYAPSATSRTLAVGALAVSGLAITWFVYATGGVKFATLHIMYLPIIFAALACGTAGGIAAGAVAGLLLGPFMPLDTVTGEAQNLGNWLYRAAFFCLVGGIVGVGVDALRKQLKILDWLNEHDARTGLLDRTGLLKTLRQMIERGGPQSQPVLIIVQINNLLDIQNTLGGSFGEKLLKEIVERGRALVPADVPIALIQPDRIALVFRNGPETRQQRAEIEARVRAPY